LSENVLEIERLSVEYRAPEGRLKALRDVGLSIPRGKVVGLVGESGCGKSTLIASIIRLLPQNAEITGGVLRFEGQDLLSLSEREMRALRGDRISVVFQDPMTSLSPVLSIGTQMRDIQYRSKSSKREKLERAAFMLSKVGIADARERLRSHSHELSGGMRQRVAIAMALQSEPALLIADEPTTALDATLEVQILELLRELQENLHCSILFISHHLGVIAELCDEVYVLYAGEVVEHGTVRDIFHRPSHPYTRKLLDCDPARIASKTRSLPTIPGGIPDLVTVPAGCIFKNRCPEAEDVCESDRPELEPVASGHEAACHLR
jgi:oligopeptide/dipeptide ABC transporter ATP-binding protein